MHPAKTLLLVTGTLALAGCSLMIDAQLDEKGTSTGSGGAGGVPAGMASSGASTTASASTSAGITTTTAAQGASSSSGGCGATCTLANATSECIDGACAISACTDKFDDCDTIAKNGCEANLNNDADHCGSCDHACISPKKCKGGKCN